MRIIQLDVSASIECLKKKKKELEKEACPQYCSGQRITRSKIKGKITNKSARNSYNTECQL